MCLFYVAIIQFPQINSISAIRFQTIWIINRQLSHRGNLLLPQIEKSFIIEVSIAHVVARYLLANLDAILLDVALKVVSWSFSDATYVEVTGDVVLGILKFDVAMKLVMAGADEGGAKGVLLVIKSNTRPILKVHSFYSTHF